MDKMLTKIVICLLLVSVFLTALCTEKKEVPSTTEMTASTSMQVTPTTEASQTIPLSDLQKDACNAADAGKTCQTKLASLGVVSLQDCCKYMNKCCP